MQRIFRLALLMVLGAVLFEPLAYGQPSPFLNPLPESLFRLEPREISEQRQFYAKSIGTAVATLADFDGDQISDYAVGAPVETGAAPRSGKVYIYSSRTDLLITTLEGTETDGRFGTSVDIADADGDCVGDILVGAPGEAGGRGRAYLYRQVNGQFVRTALATGGTGDEMGKSVVFLDGPAGSWTEKAVILSNTQFQLWGVNVRGGTFANIATTPTANPSAKFVAAAGRVRQAGRFDFAVAYATMPSTGQSYVEYHSSTDSSSLGQYRLIGGDVVASAISYIESQTAYGMDDSLVGATARPNPMLPTIFGNPMVVRIYYSAGNWYNTVFSAFGGTAVQDREFGSSIVVPDQSRILVGSPARRETASSGAIVSLSSAGAVLGIREGESVTLRSGATLALLDTTQRSCTFTGSSSGGVVITFPTPTPTPSPTPVPGGQFAAGRSKGQVASGSTGSSNLQSGGHYVLDARPLETLRDYRLHNGYASGEEVAILRADTLAIVGRQYAETKSTEFGATVRGSNVTFSIGATVFPSLVVGSPGSDHETGKVEIFDIGPILGDAFPSPAPIGTAPRTLTINGSQIGERFGEAISQFYTCAAGINGNCLAVGVPTAGEVRVFSINSNLQIVSSTVIHAPSSVAGFGSAVLAGWFTTTGSSARQLVVASGDGTVSIYGPTAPYTTVATISPPAAVGPSRAVLEVSGLNSAQAGQGLLIGYPDANQGTGAVGLLRSPLSGVFDFLATGQSAGDEFGAAVTPLAPHAVLPGELYAIGAPGANQGLGRVDIFDNNGAFVRSIFGTTPGGRFGSAVTYSAHAAAGQYDALLVGAPEDGDGKVYAYDAASGQLLKVISSKRPASQFGTSLTGGSIAYVGAPRFDPQGYARGGVTAIGTGSRPVNYTQRMGVGSRDLELRVSIGVGVGATITIFVTGGRPFERVFLALSSEDDEFGMHIPSLSNLLSWYLNPASMDGMFLGTTDGQGNLTLALPNPVGLSFQGFTFNFQALVGAEVTPARKLML